MTIGKHTLNLFSRCNPLLYTLYLARQLEVVVGAVAGLEQAVAPSEAGHEHHAQAEHVAVGVCCMGCGVCGMNLDFGFEFVS